MLAQGANGNTYDELKLELHLYGDRASVAEQFRILHKILLKCAGNATFLAANQIYIQQGQQINKNFQQVAERKFSSGIETVDFANSIETADIINRFIEEKTHGNIKDLIKPDAFSSSTRAILVNAIYFNGEWKYKFDEADTIQEHFYVRETERVLVDFMYTRATFNHAILPELDATALEMKYANSNFSFIIILPNNQSGFSALEAKMKRYNLTTIVDQMAEVEVDVKIPKFKVEFEIKLKDVLKNVCI